MEKSGDLQFVSLVSTGFSGSTLLSMLLCSQPRSIGFGDTYFKQDNPDNLCTCGVPFVECLPRCEIQDEIRLGGIADFAWGAATAVPVPRFLSVSARKYWPLWREISLTAVRHVPRSVRRALFGRFYLENRLMMSALKKSGRYDYYFDGCKDQTRLELLRTEIPGLKVIHMVRHPGAYLYHFHRLGERRHRQRLRQWARYHSRARPVRDLVGASNYLAVTYEYVVQDTGQFLRHIAEFLDMDEVYDTPPFLLRRSEIHIQGNRMRKTADRVLNLANKWRDELPEELQAEASAALRRLPWAAALFDGTDPSN